MTTVAARVVQRSLDGTAFTGRTAAVLAAAHKQFKLKSNVWCTAEGAKANGWTLVKGTTGISVPGTGQWVSLRYFNTGGFFEQTENNTNSTDGDAAADNDRSEEQELQNPQIRHKVPLSGCIPYPRGEDGRTLDARLAQQCVHWIVAQGDAIPQPISPFCVTNSAAQEFFGTAVRDTVLEVAEKESPTMKIFLSQGEQLFHASQMKAPEVLNDETCCDLIAIRLNGWRHSPEVTNSIRRRLASNRRQLDPSWLGERCLIWDSSDALKKVNAKVLRQWGVQTMTGSVFPLPFHATGAREAAIKHYEERNLRAVDLANHESVPDQQWPQGIC